MNELKVIINESRATKWETLAVSYTESELRNIFEEDSIVIQLLNRCCKYREGLDIISKWYDEDARYFCESTPTGYAKELLEEV